MQTTRSTFPVAAEWSAYSGFHRARINLLAHALTVPVFMAGTLAIPGALMFGPWWLALVGLATMAGAIGVQGITHAREPGPRTRFGGPIDFVVVIFREQWIGFPRYVASGEFARAWRES